MAQSYNGPRGAEQNGNDNCPHAYVCIPRLGTLLGAAYKQTRLESVGGSTVHKLGHS